jgi:hypothetical protein
MRITKIRRNLFLNFFIPLKKKELKIWRLFAFVVIIVDDDGYWLTLYSFIYQHKKKKSKWTEFKNLKLHDSMLAIHSGEGGGRSLYLIREFNFFFCCFLLLHLQLIREREREQHYFLLSLTLYITSNPI